MTDPIRGVNAPDALGIPSTGQAVSAPSNTGTQQSSASTGVDSADVARVEALLETITQAANTVPPVDPTRVAELQHAVNSGVYQANPQQIARMIMEIEDLLASRGRTG